jgi:hypothetical protein
MRRVLVALALMLVQAVVQAQSDAAPHRVTVGPAEVLLPLPVGFAEASTDAPALWRTGELLTPPSNRLLAFFVSAGDLQRVVAGQAPDMRRYFMVQTFRAAERDTFTDKGFAEIKDVLRSQYKTALQQVPLQTKEHLDAASRQLGKQAGRPELTLKVGEMLPLEVFDERATSLSIAALSKVVINTDAVVREIPLAMAMTTLAARGKIVYFYAYSVYDSPQDIAWCRQVTLDWLAELR